MKKHLLDLVVTENRFIGENHILMKLTSDNPLPRVLPGQFVEVRVDKTPTVFLRRPISINFVDYERNELWLLVQLVGDGTKSLSQLKKGDVVNVIMPLGNGFSSPTNARDKVLLVGGGVGIAPLLMLGSELKRDGFSVDFLLGARTESALLLLDEFRKYGTLFLTTEDGSCGEQGFVTNHSILRKQSYTKIYTCGPTPMMKSVAAFAHKSNIDCEVSLENRMACGLGACLCCVTDTNEGHKCVCSDGPVFNIKDLKWQI
jgi:dihydroorotate dehydrogenase electron transfer subunit